MVRTKHPVMYTVLFGFISAVVFVPSVILLWPVWDWRESFGLTMLSFLTGYGLLLCRWGGKSVVHIVFPLLVVAVSIFLTKSSTAFMIMCLFIFGWMRSGMALEGGWPRKIAAELACCLGGGILIAVFNPSTPVSWAMSVWLFFLVQSLYFVLVGAESSEETAPPALDPFERAKRRADAILDEAV